ncbi:alanine--tRNA ligase [Candidatus Saccharibacteria bacterium CPR2]|nr:alanine--tRNA ligase [Candidatus Saccharibacteria bacterium CPR2]
MNAHEIRRIYLDFFKQKNHAILPRTTLVPQNDPTTLFTGSGMQPMLPYLLGDDHPEGKRLADSQTCLRAEDIEEVGDNRHTTFFEMLGNWSLGDYFKSDQLPWFFEFLTDVVGLDPNKLYVSCFAGDQAANISKDEESAHLWQKLFEDKNVSAEIIELGSGEDGAKKGMQGGRIFYYDASKNWWSRTGEPSKMPSGEPGGPDSEVFYEFSEIEHDTAYGENCHPNCDCGRYLEIGNSVFMEYIKQDDGKLVHLPKKNVDFGGGLERIAAASLNTPDVFKISLLWPIVQKLEEVSGQKYEDHQESMRVIADHLRAATFLAVDGVMPSNKQQGYVMRRLMRRAIRFSLDLNFDFNVCEQVVPVVADIYHNDFPEVAQNREMITDVMIKEEKAFKQTLRKGLKVFEKLLARKHEVRGTKHGEVIFKLYDTYGFPVELTIEEAQKKNIKLEDEWQKDFDNLLKEQRERSRTATKGEFKGGLEGSNPMHKKYHTATHLLYRALRLVLGDHVYQRGSNITEERLRFDFSHSEKMTDEEIKKTEDIVNKQIKNDLPVRWVEMNTKEAQDQGARGHFGEKYGETSKVYIMGDEKNPFSMELCGGPHVDHTGELSEGDKKFKIVKEQSSSAGIRRIKAVLE